MCVTMRIIVSKYFKLLCPILTLLHFIPEVRCKFLADRRVNNVKIVLFMSSVNLDSHVYLIKGFPKLCPSDSMGWGN